MSRRQTSESFWANVKIGGPNECWLWTAHTVGGYGRVRSKGRSVYAHRWAYEDLVGPIPDGMSVLHNCPSGDDRRCVNPAHLWLGSYADNSADAAAKGRNMRGSNHTRSKLTEETATYAMARMLVGETMASIGRSYGVKPNAIRSIWIGRTWKHLWH